MKIENNNDNCYDLAVHIVRRMNEQERSDELIECIAENMLADSEHFQLEVNLNEWEPPK